VNGLGLPFMIVVIVILRLHLWLAFFVVVALATSLVVPFLRVDRLLPLVVMILLILLILLVIICFFILNRSWQNVLLRHPHRRKLNRHP
jgi:hypothetical protein